MGLKSFAELVGNLFHADEKENEEQQKKAIDLQQKVNTVYGSIENAKKTAYNPFVGTDGKILNPYLDYQKLLDSPNIPEKAKRFISLATGLTSSAPLTTPSSSENNNNISAKSDSYKVDFNANADSNNLGNMDIINDLPKLTEKQIKAIISKHYNKSTVIKPEDARALYNAQNKSGVSALVTLGIGALESGWGTSAIANKTHNLWGYGATNDNPMGNAHKYSSMEDAALGYSNSLKKDYYERYGAKTINAIGTGNNPAGKGYAYNNDGSISTTWSPNVTSIMRTLYNTAKTA